MIFIDIESVFGEGWEDVIDLSLTRGMLKAILDAFCEDIVYLSSGVPTTPDEAYSEAIEAGIASVTTALNA